MPRGNGTGPMGAGPMTGRAAGYCANVERPEFTNFAGCGGFGRGTGMGRGAGFGRGGGFGFRNRSFANGAQQTPVMTTEQEKEYMQNNIKALESELEAAKQCLKKI